MNWFITILCSLCMVQFSHSQTDDVYVLIEHKIIDQNSIFNADLIAIYNNLYHNELDSLKNKYGEILPEPSAQEFFYFEVNDQYFITEKELSTILCNTHIKTAFNMSQESWFKQYYRNYFIVRRVGEEKIKIYKTSIRELE